MVRRPDIHSPTWDSHADVFAPGDSTDGRCKSLSERGVAHLPVRYIEYVNSRARFS